MNTKQDLALSVENQMQELQLQERQFEFLNKQAKMLADCDFIPDEFKGSVANCSLICEMAKRLQADAFLVSRQIYMVYGKPSFSSKFVIALLNRSGLLHGRLKFHKTGEPGTDSEGMIAYGVEAATGDTIEGPEITIKMAKDEGWYGKKGSKWPSMSSVMLNYRAASFFVNTYFPEILAGFQTAEEVRDIGERPIEAEVTRRSRFSDSLAEEAETVIDENGATIDKETGEVLNAQTEKPKEKPKATDSPAYTALKKQYYKVVGSHNGGDPYPAELAKDLEDLLRSPLLKKCNSTEKERLTYKVHATLDKCEPQKETNN